MATTGDLHLATSGDFFMATGTDQGVNFQLPCRGQVSRAADKQAPLTTNILTEPNRWSLPPGEPVVPYPWRMTRRNRVENIVGFLSFEKPRRRLCASFWNSEVF